MCALRRPPNCCNERRLLETRVEAGRPVRRMRQSSRCKGWWLGLGREYSDGEKQTDSDIEPEVHQPAWGRERPPDSRVLVLSNQLAIGVCSE